MFEHQSKPRVFGVPLGVDFSKSLLSGIQSLSKSPEDQARTTVLLNTRRMVRRLQMLLQAGDACLHPKFRLITEVADLSPESFRFKTQDNLALRMALFPAIQRTLDLTDRVAPRAAAFDLTNSLADLFDEMEAEGVQADDVLGIDLGDYAKHWEDARKLIEVTHNIYANAEGVSQSKALRSATEELINKWLNYPPKTPVLLAGSTGSRGTTFDLMKAIAKLPQGAVILPGFDFDLPRHVWSDLAKTEGLQDHPQYRFAKLLSELGLSKDDVALWPTVQSPAQPDRNRLISLALRPAPTTHQWLAEGPDLQNIPAACADITWLEAKDQREEAETLALRLRAAVESGDSVAVVTPDRNLTRRIATALGRWNVSVDDSAGVPLPLTPPGRLLLQITSIWARDIEAETLIPLLKHPLVHSGEGRGTHLKFTRELEVAVRKGKLPNLSKQAFLDWAKKQDERAHWADWLANLVFDPSDIFEKNLDQWISNLESLAEKLSFGVHATTADLWDKEAGRKSLEKFQDLRGVSDQSPPLNLLDFTAILRNVLSSDEARDRNTPNSKIMVWGTLEARVQGADLIILAGLNEGTWPEVPNADPWLNRAMRNQVGLLVPDRQIGLAAHDFQQAVSAKQVWISRSMRSDDAETVPSRWLNRLESLLGGLADGEQALADMKARAQSWVTSAKALDVADEKPDRARRPAPKPPKTSRPKSLSVTSIKTLIRDPYAIYATSVLNLHRIDPLGKPLGPALRGTLVHDVLENFVKLHGKSPDAAVLHQMLANTVQTHVPNPAQQKFWLSRIGGFVDWFIKDEIGRQSQLVGQVFEAEGRLKIPDLDFELVGKADRLDISETGWVRIFDYKTGSAPSENEQLYFDKQLPLLAEMAVRGAFAPTIPKGVLEAAYIQLKYPCRIVGSAEMAGDFWSDFKAFIHAYVQGDNSFPARRAMLKSDTPSDYDHLSRFGEWDVSARADVVEVAK